MQSVSEPCTFIQDVIPDIIQNRELRRLCVLPTTETHNADIPFTWNNQVNSEETVVHKKYHRHFLLQQFSFLNEVSALAYYQEEASRLREQLKRFGSLHNYISCIHITILPTVKAKVTSIINSGICRRIYLSYFTKVTAIRQCLLY
jgi:hypothetical protein